MMAAATAAKPTMAPENDSVAAANGAHTEPALHSEFLNRVGSLPVVTSALESAFSIYDASKHRFHVISNLESSIKARVLPQLTPLVSHLQTSYEPRLAQIDAFACTGLTMLETRLPILREPTETVLETSRRVLDERILGPVQSARETVTRSIASASHGRVNVNGLVESALDLSEQAVDRFLPEEATSVTTDAGATTAATDAGAASTATTSATTTNGTAGAAEHGQQTASAASTFVRAQKLGNTVRQRLTRRTAAQLRRVPLPATAGKGAVASTTAAAVTSTSQLLLAAAEGLQRQLAWLASSLTVLQANVVGTERAVAGNLGRIASHATASAQHYTHGVLASLHTALAAFNSRLPLRIQRDTDYLRRLVVDQLQALLDSRTHPPHTWVERASQAVNATMQYLGAVQTHLLQFVAQHTPPAVARLLPSTRAATASRRRERAAANGAAGAAATAHVADAANGSNGHVADVDKTDGNGTNGVNPANGTNGAPPHDDDAATDGQQGEQDDEEDEQDDGEQLETADEDDE